MSTAQEKAEQVGREVSTQAQGLLQRIREHSPNSRQMLGLVSLLTAGAVVLIVGGLTLTGTALTVAIGTPVLIFFSPVLVPLAIVLFLALSGALTVGGFGLAIFSGIAWIYNYVKGRHPPGSDQVDAARHRFVETASQLKGRVTDYGAGTATYANAVKDSTLDASQQAMDAAPGA